MARRKINILMTCTGGDLAPEYICAMKNSTRYDVSVLAVDGNPEAIGQYFADHFRTVPMGHADNYIDTIRALVREFGITMILAGSDGEALALSSAKQVLAAEGCTVCCPDPEVLANLANKADTYIKLREAGIPHADFASVSSLDGLQAAITDFAQQYGEFVIKPAISRGGRNVFVVRTDIDGEQSYYGGREIHCTLDVLREKYQKGIADLFPVLVMERLVEPTYDIDVLTWSGEPVNVIPRKRHNPAGIPFTGNTIMLDKPLVDLGMSVSRIFNLSWLLDVDVMCRKDGTPVVLEVNPRWSGSCPSSVRAGVPLFDNIMALVVGDEPDRVVPQDRTVVLPYNALQVVKPS